MGASAISVAPMWKVWGHIGKLFYLCGSFFIVEEIKNILLK